MNAMVTSQPNPVAALMTFMLTLQPDNLVRFYCADCLKYMERGIDEHPTNPFQENTGWCARCRRCQEVSNPYINRFLNSRGLTLKYPSYFNPNSEVTLIRDWLIPYSYGFQREVDVNGDIDARTSWLRYGRRQCEQVERSPLAWRNKRWLLAYFKQLYTASRYEGEPRSKSNRYRLPLAWFRNWLT